MPLFKKAMLSVGTHESPDGAIVVTPKRLRHWERTFKRMRAAKLKMPSAWDHSDDPKKAVPVPAVRFGTHPSSKDAAGELVDLKVSADGRSAELTLDLKDDKAVDKASKNIVEISPVIFPEWTDGKGRTWKDCVTHVDLVLQPVDHKQTPFTRVPDEHPIACSLRMGLQSGKPETYRMAKASSKPATKSGKPAKIVRQRMATDDESDEDKDKEKTTTEDEGGEGKSEEECLARVLALLKEFGIGTPDGISAENFLEQLEASLTGAKAMKEKLDGEGDEDDEEEEAAGQPSETSPAFTAMSLQARSAHQFAEKQYRLGITGRLTTLRDSGRCTPNEFDDRKPALKAVRLSLNTKTNEPDASDLERWIESREAVPAGTFWDSETRAQRMSKVTETQPSRDLIGADLTDDEAEDIVDQMFGKKKAKA